MKRYLVVCIPRDRFHRFQTIVSRIPDDRFHRFRVIVSTWRPVNMAGRFCSIATRASSTSGGEIVSVLRISARRVDRVTKRFVEDGLEAALGGRQGRRAKHVRKADGEFEARLAALSCGDPHEGYARWSLRLSADRAV